MTVFLYTINKGLRVVSTKANKLLLIQYMALIHGFMTRLIISIIIANLLQVSLYEEGIHNFPRAMNLCLDVFFHC